MTPRRRDLAATLFRVGLTSFGGPAIVAQIRETVVERKRWVSEEEFQESLALCQFLPGPIAVQTAAHIGWRLRRGLGAAIALAAYTAPAFLLMLALSAAYFRFHQLPAVVVAMRGLAAAIVAIVAHAIWGLAQPTLRDWRGVVIAVLAAAGLIAGLETLVVLGLAAAAGVACAQLGLCDIDPPAPAAPAPRLESWPATVAACLAVGTGFAAIVALSGRLEPALPALGAALAKINLLAFGGGYTAVALMHHDFVAGGGQELLTPDEFVAGLALGQVTPGPVILTATFIGVRVAGVLGGAFATVAVLLPSSLLLVALAPLFARVRDLRLVRGAIRGLLAGFVAMLLVVLYHVCQSAFTTAWAPLLSLACLAALRLRAPMAAVLLGAITAAALLPA